MLHWKVKKRSTMYLNCNSKKEGKVEKISRTQIGQSKKNSILFFSNL